MERINASTGGESNSLDGLFSCLASSDRRHLLGHVHERAPDAVTRETLATTIAAESQNVPPEEVADEERERALATLHHVHLPKLEAAGLITQDGNSIALADHPAYEDAGVLAAIRGGADAGTPSLDELFRALTEARRRTVLDVLSHQYQPIYVQTLARDVASARPGADHPEDPAEDVEGVYYSLHHVHLPRLQRAGLVDYDADEGTVSYEGHPLLRVPWMHSELGPDFRASLTDGPTDADVWTIDGRENVVSCGQSLCEEADEELFLMFTTTGLLEAGCFSRIEQAVDRGVNVYLGTADPTVREFVRERAPEVTLWKPQTNWLAFPIEGKNVGRLVFADREAVMIGTLEERSDAGVHRERAILGEGADNTLVVLLRQMLYSQFDQFDDQVGDIEAKLPF